MRSESSIWPRDVIQDPRELERGSPHQLVCFHLTPFEPASVFDPLHTLVKMVCHSIGEKEGIDIDVRRADTFVEAKPIHDDIWRHILAADFLVVDLTGLNANVMIELGVAASIRKPLHLIFIRSADEDGPLPFNMFAQRCLPYERSVLGDTRFANQLRAAIIQAITPAPYVPEDRIQPISVPCTITFEGGRDDERLISPSSTHRRIVGKMLEFGSYYVFHKSWLLVGNQNFADVRVTARVEFGSRVGGADDGFISLSIRNQHFFANYGYYTLVRPDGSVWRTQPKDEAGNYEDVRMGELSSAERGDAKVIEIVSSFSPTTYETRVGSVAYSCAVQDLPYVFPSGRIRVSTSKCRMRLHSIRIDATM
jgi:hypothetical protein